MERVRRRDVWGHLEHPKDGKPDLNEAAFIVVEISLDESTGEVRGTIETLNTSKGKDAKALLEAGVPVGISSRAHGSVVTRHDGLDEVQDDFVPETFDLVAEPSTIGAYITESVNVPLEERKKLEIQEKIRIKLSALEESMDSQLYDMGWKYWLQETKALLNESVDKKLSSRVYQIEDNILGRERYLMEDSNMPRKGRKRFYEDTDHDIRGYGFDTSLGIDQNYDYTEEYGHDTKLNIEQEYDHIKSMKKKVEEGGLSESTFKIALVEQAEGAAKKAEKAAHEAQKAAHEAEKEAMGDANSKTSLEAKKLAVEAEAASAAAKAATEVAKKADSPQEAEAAAKQAVKSAQDAQVASEKAKQLATAEKEAKNGNPQMESTEYGEGGKENPVQATEVCHRVECCISFADMPEEAKKKNNILRVGEGLEVLVVNLKGKFEATNCPVRKLEAHWGDAGEIKICVEVTQSEAIEKVKNIIYSCVSYGKEPMAEKYGYYGHHHHYCPPHYHHNMEEPEYREDDDDDDEDGRHYKKGMMQGEMDPDMEDFEGRLADSQRFREAVKSNKELEKKLKKLQVENQNLRILNQTMVEEFEKKLIPYEVERLISANESLSPFRNVLQKCNTLPSLREAANSFLVAIREGYYIKENTRKENSKKNRPVRETVNSSTRVQSRDVYGEIPLPGQNLLVERLLNDATVADGVENEDSFSRLAKYLSRRK